MGCGGRGRNNFLTGMLTFDFSLCLIQCAISRCIIYFCVNSLTAVICHDDDDSDDGASFFPDTRMLHLIWFPPPFNVSR